MIIETEEKLSHCPSSVTEQEHSQVVINKHLTSTDTSKAFPEEHKGEGPKEQAPSCNKTLEQEVESPGHTFETPTDVAAVDYLYNEPEVTTIVCAYIDVLYDSIYTRCMTVAYSMGMMTYAHQLAL